MNDGMHNGNQPDICCNCGVELPSWEVGCGVELPRLRTQDPESTIQDSERMVAGRRVLPLAFPSPRDPKSFNIRVLIVM